MSSQQQFNSHSLPGGGITGPILRRDVWENIYMHAVMYARMRGLGEQPNAERSHIRLLQEPDANGRWTEEWVVSMGFGRSEIVFNVEFIPSPQGGTDFGISGPLP